MPLPRPAPGTGRWWVVGVVGIGLAVAAITWVGVRDASQRISATTVGYKVVDDATVRITFDVIRPRDLAVTCTLRAMDGSFTVVGTSDVLLPPGDETGTRHVETIRTATRAVTGVVQDCVRGSS